MRYACAFLFLISSLTMAHAGGEKDAGFTPIFDGKSFAGWKTSDNTAKSWKIENGMLICTGGSVNINTDKSYTDFILRLEWRAAKKGYNSGVFLRGNNQINLAEKQVGGLIGNKAAKAVPELHKAPGEWNEWEVTVIGSKMTLKVNGKEAWSIDDFKAKPGYIGLQAEGQHIDFKNLRVKEVK